MNWKKIEWVWLVFFYVILALTVVLTIPYAKFATEHVLGPLDLPLILGILIGFLLLIIPPLLIMFGLLYCHGKIIDKVMSQQTISYRGSTQLKNLNKAHKTLSASLKYLDELRGSIQDGQKQQKELKLLVESLRKASQESASELKKKLAAIGYVNKRKEYLRFALGFALGVISSLMATAIWSLLSIK